MKTTSSLIDTLWCPLRKDVFFLVQLTLRFDRYNSVVDPYSNSKPRRMTSLVRRDSWMFSWAAGGQWLAYVSSASTAGGCGSCRSSRRDRRLPLSLWIDQRHRLFVVILILLICALIFSLNPSADHLASPYAMSSDLIYSASEKGLLWLLHKVPAKSAPVFVPSSLTTRSLWRSWNQFLTRRVQVKGCDNDVTYALTWAATEL